MNGMTAIVLALDRSAEAVALGSALEAGLGSVRLVVSRAQAKAALSAHPRAIFVLDLRSAPASFLDTAARLRSEHPGVRSLALVDAGSEAPPHCDSVFTAPVFLEDVVRWCARSLVAPLAEGILEDLAAGLCHEIGNPLTSLFLQLELLRVDEDMESIRSHLQLIEESARRIQSVVRDVAKAAERKPVVAQASTLGALLAQTRSRLESRQPALAERLEVSCADAAATLDATALSEALADVWEYLLLAGHDEDTLSVDAGPQEGQGLVIRHRAHVPRLPIDAAGRLFTPLWARQALGLPEGISLTSARNAFVRHRGDLRARQLPEGLLLVEALLPDETQATFEFPS
jgi:hypothetical protein